MTNLFIKYLLQINESTAEDRYRKKLGLQPLEELSEYEKLERYSKDDSIMISFRDEYYSKTKRIGLSLKSYKGTDKTTPNGIYCYPLKKLWPNFDHKEKAIVIVSNPETKIFIPSKPHAIAVLKLKYDNCLDFRSYDEEKFKQDFKNLYDKYYVKTKTIENNEEFKQDIKEIYDKIKNIKNNKKFKQDILGFKNLEEDFKNLYDKYHDKIKNIENFNNEEIFKQDILAIKNFEKDFKNFYDKYAKTIEDFKDEIKNVKENSFIRHPQSDSKNNVYYSNMIWLAFFYVYRKIKKSNDVNVFTKIIKEAGYNSVYDTYGIIHIGITTQIVIFKQEAYELIEVIDVNEINKKSNDFDSLYMPTKTKNEKIYKLIIKASDKDYEKNINKIKSLLKNLDNVNYSPKGQEPLIHYFINNNKPEMVKELTSYPKFNPNIKFKDYYINPIMFAVYKNNTKIVETLLSTNKLKNFKDIKNVFGKTVLDMANDNKNKKIIDLLTK